MTWTKRYGWYVGPLFSFALYVLAAFGYGTYVSAFFMLGFNIAWALARITTFYEAIAYDLVHGKRGQR